MVGAGWGGSCWMRRERGGCLAIAVLELSLGGGGQIYLGEPRAGGARIDHRPVGESAGEGVGPQGFFSESEAPREGLGGLALGPVRGDHNKGGLAGGRGRKRFRPENGFARVFAEKCGHVTGDVIERPARGHLGDVAGGRHEIFLGPAAEKVTKDDPLGEFDRERLDPSQCGFDIFIGEPPGDVDGRVGLHIARRQKGDESGGGGGIDRGELMEGIVDGALESGSREGGLRDGDGPLGIAG